MKAVVIMKILRLVYEQIIREMIVDYVKSTENDYDDMIVDVLDRVFALTKQ